MDILTGLMIVGVVIATYGSMSKNDRFFWTGLIIFILCLILALGFSISPEVLGYSAQSPLHDYLKQRDEKVDFYAPLIGTIVAVFLCVFMLYRMDPYDKRRKQNSQKKGKRK